MRARGDITWDNFRGDDEGDPGDDHEEAGGEVDLQQHWRPASHHIYLENKMLSIG